MTPLWSSESIADLESLRAHIEQDDAVAARRITLQIIQTVEMLLAEHPGMGRPGRIPGTRELVIPTTRYIVPYRIEGNRIQVLRVLHSAQRWPEKL